MSSLVRLLVALGRWGVAPGRWGVAPVGSQPSSILKECWVRNESLLTGSLISVGLKRVKCTHQ